MCGAAESGGRGAFILLVTFAMALSLWRPVASSPATYRLCGKKLADLLSLVCRDRGYYDPFAPKPAYAREPYRENRLGVSDECCRIGCTEATLKSYCAPSEDDYGDPDTSRDEQPVTASPRGAEQISEGEGSAAARVPAATKVSREGGKRRRGGGGGGGRRKGGARARLPRGGGKGKRCRCRRRRRKTDAESNRRPHTSFQIGTIAPSFLGTPVILSRTRVIS